MNAENLQGIRTAQVADVLDTLGYRNQVMDASITPVQPGLWALGPAVTVAFEESNEADTDDPYGAMIDLIDGLMPGELVVMATASWQASALWGELFSAGAMGRGAVGVVMNGCARDTPQIRALGFPVFSAGFKPLDYKRRQIVVSRDLPVVCGGVTVAKGDWILADDDGVVVIPLSVSDEVLDLARERVSGETTVKDELLAGDTIREVWERHGLL